MRKSWAAYSALFLSGVMASTLSATAQVNSSLYAGLQWRSVGPFHGGRISSVSGVVGDAGTFYMGTPLGGIWKTTSAGVTWVPIFDRETSVDSIGAIAVAPSAPSIVYAGAGDPIGGSLGNGMWKSTDAGSTWQHIGLEDTVKIDSIVVDPADPNLVVVSALGDEHHPGGGVYRSTNGGASWTNVLKPANYEGIRDLQSAYDDPSVMVAATQGTGTPGRPGVGGSQAKAKPPLVFKSTDDGRTWTEIKIPPFPGRVALAIAMHTGGKRMYIVGNDIEKGSGLYRSDDGGETWQHMAGKDLRISNGQGAYSSGVFVDSQNPDIVYTMSTAMYRSTDGGVTFEPFKGAPGGEDYHKLWIDPTNGHRMVVGSDQGASVTLDDGKTWSLWYTQPIAQVYHVATDHQYPYHILAAQQDTGAVMISSRGNWGQINFNDWSPVPSSEFGVVTPDPKNPNILYGVGYGPGGGGSGIVKIDMATGQWQNVAPNFGSESAKFFTSRDFQKKFDLGFDPGALYVAYQCLMVTRDGAHSFTAASPDLTLAKGAPAEDCSQPRPQPARPQPGQTPPPPPPAIADFSISRVKPGVIWTVSTNGQIDTTTDHGKVWSNVSNIEGLPAHTNFNTVETGHNAETAYVAARIGGVRGETVPPEEDADVPLIWRTVDGGKTWTSIVNGLPRDERTGSWVNSLRVDPEQPGLLFAGTETTVYVSFDNGDHWQSLRQNLPSTSIRDLDVHTDDHENDLVIGTYGRGFWVLDDITPLRQIAAHAQAIGSSQAYFFEPEDAIRARINSNWDQPFSIEVPHAHNVQYGAILDYFLSKEPSGPIQLQVFDSDGKLVRTMTSTLPPPIEGAAYPYYWLATPESRALSAHVGLNRVNWNLEYDDPPALRHDLENQMNMTPGATNPGPHGPQVIPGVYTLKLTVDGQVYTRTVTVVNDPRVGQSPELMAALRSQNKLTMLSVEGMKQSYAGHEEVKSVTDQLATLMHGEVPADVSTQAKTLDAALTKIGGAVPAGFEGGPGRPAAADPKALKTFVDLNNAYNTMVSMVQVGLDMAPTPTQIATWESDCKDYDRTVDAWKSAQQQITDFNVLLVKSQMKPLTLTPTKLTSASCSFDPERGRKGNRAGTSR
ncbi:MAG: WD40/YVTN/BNR-like repeat-containing protein [Acidobacteriota bacterium]